MFLFEFLDLPKIPKEILDTISLENPGKLYRPNPGWAHKFDDEKEIRSADNPNYYANEHVTKWVKENVCDPLKLKYTTISARYSMVTPEVNWGGVHTDDTRKGVILYSYRPCNGKVVFYKDERMPLFIPEGYIKPGDYTKLEVIGEFETPQDTWYMLNPRVLHNVVGMTDMRVNIQIGLQALPEKVPTFDGWKTITY